MKGDLSGGWIRIPNPRITFSELCMKNHTVDILACADARCLPLKKTENKNVIVAANIAVFKHSGLRRRQRFYGLILRLALSLFPGAELALSKSPGA